MWAVEQLAITLIESEITLFSAHKHFNLSTDLTATAMG